jgi:hypothetical protein
VKSKISLATTMLHRARFVEEIIRFRDPALEKAGDSAVDNDEEVAEKMLRDCAATNNLYA